MPLGKRGHLRWLKKKIAISCLTCRLTDPKLNSLTWPDQTRKFRSGPGKLGFRVAPQDFSWYCKVQSLFWYLRHGFKFSNFPPNANISLEWASQIPHYFHHAHRGTLNFQLTEEHFSFKSKQNLWILFLLLPWENNSWNRTWLTTSLLHYLNKLITLILKK